MRLSRFDYRLPPEAIAQHPLAERDAARLLVLRRASRTWEDRRVRDLPELLQPGDLLVFNDTRVIPARLRATRAATGGKVEIFLLPIEPAEAAALARLAPAGGCARRVLTRSGGKLREGEALELSGGVRATLLERRGEAGDVLGFSLDDAAFAAFVEAQGEVPLPPYIQRPAGPSAAEDRARYQTVFAREPGAVAAPTAGLHFTPALLDALDEHGVERANLTLHVGMGTFRTVKAEEIEAHAVDPEPFHAGAAAAAAVTRALREGRRVIPVGTTSTRVLEARWDAAARELRSGHGTTDLFIRPPFEFQVAGALMTNFHLPKSSLLMLVAAFAEPGGTAGIEFVLRAYEHAKAAGYRFFSYGDACLLL
ncbi:MAG: tRNA preQ1(34) S-adenosylmethionine ribosyltransferase-isomerase QueA [Planctomycetota bacterium]|nr:tRNA preQ1(34) S-adenosylmethionine ribosyltransferase-isomerase QueA [Planctomycetota bacterium]